MDDELLKTLMESVDPARDLSDETLHELLPDDQLMARIAAGIAAEPLEAVRVKSIPFWRRVPTLIGASAAALVIAVAGAATLFGSSPALLQGTGAVTKTTTSVAAGSVVAPTITRSSGTGITVTGADIILKRCLPSQISEWMVTSSGPYVATRDFTGRVIYENTGRACTLARTYIGVQAVAGTNRVAIGNGSVTPTVAILGKLTLQRGQTAAATFFVGSTTSPSFRRLLKAHDGTCGAKFANAIKVFGLYSGWPVKYFALPERLLVCTSGYGNVGAGPIAKTKRVIVHG